MVLGKVLLPPGAYSPDKAPALGPECREALGAETALPLLPGKGLGAGDLGITRLSPCLLFLGALNEQYRLLCALQPCLAWEQPLQWSWELCDLIILFLKAVLEQISFLEDWQFNVLILK